MIATRAGLLLALAGACQRTKDQAPGPEDAVVVAPAAPGTERVVPPSEAAPAVTPAPPACADARSLEQDVCRQLGPTLCQTNACTPRCELLAAGEMFEYDDCKPEGFVVLSAASDESRPRRAHWIAYLAGGRRWLAERPIAAALGDYVDTGGFMQIESLLRDEAEPGDVAGASIYVFAQLERGGYEYAEDLGVRLAIWCEPDDPPRCTGPLVESLEWDLLEGSRTLGGAHTAEYLLADDKSTVAVSVERKLRGPKGALEQLGLTLHRPGKVRYSKLLSDSFAPLDAR